MALGILFLLFIIMGLVAVIGAALLFLVKSEKANDIILVLMTAYSFVLAFLAATSLPSNFVLRQFLCWIAAFVAAAGTGYRFAAKKQSLLSRILVVLSVAGGIINLFLL